MRELAATAGKAYLADMYRQLEQHGKALDAAIETLDALIHLPDARDRLAKIARARAGYAASAGRVLQLMEAGKASAALRLVYAEILPALEAMHAPLKGLLATQGAGVPAGATQTRKTVEAALSMMAILEGAPSAVWRSSASVDC